MKRVELLAKLKLGIDPNAKSELDPKQALLCHVPDVAPRAYLHVVFAPVEEHAIRRFQDSTGILVPHAYAEVLRSFNGAMLFSCALSFDGIVENFTRSLESRQPFDLLDSNRLNRPIDARPEDFFIGGMNWDGSSLFLRGDSPVVYRRLRDSPACVNSWPSIDALLEERISALALLYDRFGRKHVPEAPTIPEWVTSSIH